MTVDITKYYDFSKAVVKCDDSNNPPSILDVRKVRIVIIVPSKFNGYESLVITPPLLERDKEI